MTEEGNLRIQGFVNPLAFFSIEDMSNRTDITASEIIRDLCKPREDSSIESIRQRYKELTHGIKNLHMAPLEEKIMSKLVWPLRQAKTCYILGSHLGCIALCGMVAETLCILVYEIWRPYIDKKQAKANKQRLPNKRFQQLRQEQRINVLTVLGIFDESIAGIFDNIRKTRNKYIHYYKSSEEELKIDSLEIFRKILPLLVNVLGQGIKDFKFTFRPEILEYLKEKGIVNSDNKPNSDENISKG